MKIIMLLLMFLLIGGLFIISNNSLYLKNKEDMAKFTIAYYTWLDKIYVSALNITGYIVKTDWLPDNKTAVK